MSKYWQYPSLFFLDLHGDAESSKKSFDIKTIVWQSLSQEERDKYQDWKRLKKSQPKPKSPILNKASGTNREIVEQKRHPTLPSSQSLDEKKINPPIIKRSSKPTLQSEQNRGNETPDYKALNGLLFQLDTYSEDEAEHDWSGAKYDPAWDDGSAFPSKQD